MEISIEPYPSLNFQKTHANKEKNKTFVQFIIIHYITHVHIFYFVKNKKHIYHYYYVIEK